MTYAIVVSEFNSMLTERMLEECVRGFKEQGIEPEVYKVPGAVEIPLMVQDVIQKKKPAAVVTLGVVIEGETEHYRTVCDMCSQGLMNLMLKHHVPIVFEVLMTDTYQKAEARIEKGYHAAFVATRMASELA